MGSVTSGVRSWDFSAFLTVLPLPVTPLQNDLNKGGTRKEHTNSPGQASSSLEEEKSRLLAEAAVELREENTRQERILALAKRLAVLQGQDPSRGKGSGQPPYTGPLAKTYCYLKLYFPCQYESRYSGSRARGSVSCPEP